MSPGTLHGVLGPSLKFGYSWYFTCAQLLPKTKYFLTSVYSQKLQPLNKSLLHGKHRRPVFFYFRCYLNTMMHYKFPKGTPNNVNWMVILQVCCSQVET